MIGVGRICTKIAGRDAGQKCVVVSVVDNTYVMIDGATRRRKCNIAHLEPTPKVINIQNGAEHKIIVAEFKKLGIKLEDKKSRKTPPRPMKKRKVSEKTEEAEVKTEKKAEKKTEKPKKEAKQTKLEAELDA